MGFPAAEKKFQKIFLEFAWFFFKIGFFVQTLLKSCLFQNVDKCSRRNLYAGFSSNSNRTGFDGMVKLTMTSFLPDLLLTIQLNCCDKVFNFHAASLTRFILMLHWEHAKRKAQRAKFRWSVELGEGVA